MKRDYPLRKGSYDGKLSEEIVEFVKNYNFGFNDDFPHPKKTAAESASKPVSEVEPTPADIRPSAAVEVRRPFSTEAPAAQPMKAAASTPEPEKNNKLLIVIAIIVAAAGIGTAAALLLHKDSEGGGTKKSKADSSDSGAVTVSANSEGDPSEVEVIEDSNDEPAPDDSDDGPQQGNDTESPTTTTAVETVPVMETTTPFVPFEGDDTDTTTEDTEPAPASDEAPVPMNLTEYTLHYGSDTSSCWIVKNKVDIYGQAMVDTNGNPIYVISEVPDSLDADNMKGDDVKLYQEDGIWYLYYGIDNKKWAPYDNNTYTYVTIYTNPIILAEDGEG